jgi:hypothetical protein
MHSLGIHQKIDEPVFVQIATEDSREIAGFLAAYLDGAARVWRLRYLTPRS